jgi:hypothetical protein
VFPQFHESAARLVGSLMPDVSLVSSSESSSTYVDCMFVVASFQNFETMKDIYVLFMILGAASWIFASSKIRTTRICIVENVPSSCCV